MYITRLIENSLQKSLASKKISIITGARQVGKTTLIQHALEGTKTTFLNFDVEPDKQRILAASQLAPRDAIRSLGTPDYLVLDEAQKIAAIGSIVKGWYDSGIATKIVLLGSSSLDLLNTVAESLTGRNEKIALTPLLFKELISTKTWAAPSLSEDQLETLFPRQVQETLFTSMVFGSYPEAAQSDDAGGYLLNLASDYLFKDVLQLGLVKSPDAIRKLLTLLAHQVGSEVSFNELAGNLGIARQTVERYLELLEQTFVVFKVPAYSTNPRKEIVKSQKIYFWDTGVRNAVVNDFSQNALRSDIGALWENWCMAEFAKLNALHGNRKKLFFWRSRVGSEVDLLIQENDILSAYEFKWSDRRFASKAFTARYGIPVTVVTNAVPLTGIRFNS